MVELSQTNRLLTNLMIRRFAEPPKADCSLLIRPVVAGLTL